MDSLFALDQELDSNTNDASSVKLNLTAINDTRTGVFPVPSVNDLIIMYAPVMVMQTTMQRDAFLHSVTKRKKKTYP